MNQLRPQTRIQRKNTAAILEAALAVFSRHGFRGATLDQIAQAANLSKPNLLYYFASKEAIHSELLSAQMDVWLEPLRRIDAQGDAVAEIVAYVLRKLEMARDLPRESRLFANEIVQGAPRIMGLIQGELRTLVNQKATLIQGWIDVGRIAALDPHHLIFSIWATTQHYADFEAQVHGILGPDKDAHFAEAARFLRQFYERALTPG
ncbi:MAG: TetR family transcriptional regulator C-terminal domain-containing protein [Paracoccaceae bacterium]